MITHLHQRPRPTVKLKASLVSLAVLSSLEQPRVTPETQDEIEAKAAFIVSTLGSTYRDYAHACEAYNVVFFRDESKEFAAALASALVNHFPAWPNLFWNKLTVTASTTSPLALA